jgi:predicted 2-oxoglutarate/Fe(II)-dependent dioxygenase YbiX
MTWFPRVSTYLAEKHDHINSKLPSHHANPHLSNSPFTSATVNLGPHTVTRPHRDAGNLQSGLCAVFLPGAHKAEDGGDLVLDEAKVVMELGAGDMVIFPSALITHWNTTLKPGKIRQSMVFWTCGGSIRYYDMGERLMKTLSEDERQAEAKRAAEHWRAGVQRFSLLSQLVDSTK